MLFEYAQDSGGSIRISNIDTNYMPYLSDLGYSPKIYASGINSVTDNYVVNQKNYVDQYLFTSDEMLGSSYKAETIHNVRIKFNVENGTVKNTVVWVQGLDGQGFKSE